MRPRALILALAAVTTTACGGGNVAVQAQLEAVATGAEMQETVALGSLPIRLLPYDRDAIFDSLAEAYPEPEPVLPDTLFALQQQVADRYVAWQQANSRWGLLRDTLQTLASRMADMDQRSGEYFALFQDFNELEEEVGDLERRADDAFQAFTSLQSRLTNAAREVRLRHDAWARDAYAPVDSVIQARLAELRLREYADTTSAQGVGRFRGVPPGRWWVYARYDRQFDELYWNYPIRIERGDEVEVILNERNAEVRPKL